MNPTDEVVTETTWDVAILGAGPAGSVAASLLAARGMRVLLVEKSSWPREKVCGGCVSAAAAKLLTSAGLSSTLRNGQRINRAIWHVGKKSLEIPADEGVAMLRSDLDSALVDAAIKRGCTFISNTAAKLLPDESRGQYRIVRLKTDGISKDIRAKVVLACDGITGTSVNDEPWAKWRIDRGAWIGASVTCSPANPHWRTGDIHMHIARGGYVGAVRLPDSQLHIAAALNPVRCRQAGGPTVLIETILRSYGQFEIPNLQGVRLRGSGAMTRHREHLGGHRVLVVGDAGGYVEPFTGEGMAWAIRSAIEVDNLLHTTEDWPETLPTQWAIVHHGVIGQKQLRCKALRPLVHHPSVAMLGISVASVIPAIGRFLASRICESDFPIAAGAQGDFR
jgi:menaquinone-9 beta-reductase